MDVPKPSRDGRPHARRAFGERSGVALERPFAWYGALVGWGAARSVPAMLRPSAYRVFARAVGADLSEAELALSEYPTFGDLFVRRLRAGARIVDDRADAIISPCDGVVAAIGTATDGTLIQAKGRDYELAELVADDELAAQLTGGEYVTIYLSPRDYHRVHSPIAGRVTGYDYLPGALWPVNPRVAARRDRLLSRNERVVIHLDGDAMGPAALVMVGATGVGHIELAHLATTTGPWRPQRERQHAEISAPVARGDELGAFLLGSTVVLVFAPGAIARGDVREGDSVRFGQRLFSWARGRA